MAKKVRMSDIAEKFGVSVVTVSKALTGQKGVSEELRARILQAADEMGYRTKQTVSTNAKVKNFNIGVLVPDKYLDKYESFYWYIYQNIVAQATEKNCFIILETISQQNEAAKTIPKVVQEGKIDGIVMLGRPAEGYLKMLRESSSLPVVCLDFYDEKSGCDCIISDGYNGAYLMTNYLLAQGHKDIAYVGTLLHTSSITDRYFGYMKALYEHGEKVREDWIVKDRDTNQDDVANYPLVLPSEMPTAFVCNCDLTASVVIKKLRANGYRVPEDISVVGFDNYIYPGICDIGITTYGVDVSEMTRKSLDLVTKQILHKKDHSKLYVIEGDIVIRESACPPQL